MITHDYDLEEQLLSALILNPTNIDDVIETGLSIADFYGAHNASV